MDAERAAEEGMVTFGRPDHDELSWLGFLGYVLPSYPEEKIVVPCLFLNDQSSELIVHDDGFDGQHKNIRIFLQYQ